MTADTPAQVREYLERKVVPYLPTSIRAVSFEVNAWLVTVHTFQHGMLDDGNHPIHTDARKRYTVSRARVIGTR